LYSVRPKARGEADRHSRNIRIPKDVASKTVVVDDEFVMILREPTKELGQFTQGATGLDEGGV
jgi:hypothetical protein